MYIYICWCTLKHINYNTFDKKILVCKPCFFVGEKTHGMSKCINCTTSQIVYILGKKLMNKC